MKNTKEIIYSILSSDEWILSLIWDVGQIHYQTDNEEENRAKESFDASKPIITYYRISEKSWDYPKRVSLFQITCWSKDNLESESIKNSIVACLHRKRNSGGISYAELTDVWSDIYDKEFKVWWIPLTFVVVCRDDDF